MAVHRKTTDNHAPSMRPGTSSNRGDRGISGLWGCCVYSIWKPLRLRPENSLPTQPLVLRFVPSRVEIVKLSQVKRAEVNEPS